MSIQDAVEAGRRGGLDRQMCIHISEVCSETCGLGCWFWACSCIGITCGEELLRQKAGPQPQFLFDAVGLGCGPIFFVVCILHMVGAWVPVQVFFCCFPPNFFFFENRISLSF